MDPERAVARSVRRYTARDGSTVAAFTLEFSTCIAYCNRHRAAPRRHGATRRRRGFKIVEFEFRVRVRVSSNFLPLTSTKTVELPN